MRLPIRASLALALLFAMPAMAQDHSGHAAPAAQEHAQHQAKPEPAEPMDHAAMGHTMAAPDDAPRTPIPEVTDADRAAAFAHVSHHDMQDNSVHHYLQFNRLEGFDSDEGSGLAWEVQSWIGTDLDRLWLRSDGERAGGRTEEADLELLYGRAIARWWDAVVGIRHDFKPGDSRDFLAVGVMGLAPYKFEVAATAYLGEGGQTAARIEVEYETLLTNRLVLQPLVEFNLHGKDDPARGIGSGLSTAEAGLRLRYEFTREFAPYIGIERTHRFGNTAGYARAVGEPVAETRWVAGNRFWF